MARSRRVDPDLGPGRGLTKKAEIIDAATDDARVENRASLRELDAMTEHDPRLTRQQKDRARIFPRETVADLRHPRMERQLPAADQERGPLPARQRNVRSKKRLAAQGDMPLTQLVAMKDLVGSKQRWCDINDAMSAHTGDVDELSERDQERVRRADRAIQAYERMNDRGHVVYTNVQLPPAINSGNMAGWLRNNFEPGRRFAFDRYTFSTHQLHETAADGPDTGRTVVFEMQTRRGAYLGRSDKVDDTGHLLPRGMEFEVVGYHEASYRAPDGTTGTRTVVQLRDVTPQDKELFLHALARL